MSSRFVVVCPARTGSTMLMTALRQHADLLTHGEVFGDRPDVLKSVGTGAPTATALFRLRQLDPAFFFSEVVLSPDGRAGVGCKFKYEELVLVRWRPAVRALLGDRSIRVILLWRENLLARFLSEFRATRVTGLFNARGEEPVPAMAPVRLGGDECEHNFSLTELRRSRVVPLFADHPVLSLTYDDLVTDPDGSFARVQSFLDVRVVPISPGTKRLRHTPLAEAIANYDELEARFRGTPYARFFEPAAGA